MKNSIDFSSKLKKGISLEILGPGILLDELGVPKKVNNKNDMFFFSFSPLLCYQPIFGYGLEKLNASQIIFNSKKILEDNSLMYYSDKLDKKDDHFMLFNPSCFLFPKENNCLPGDTFLITEKENLLNFASYKKFPFKQKKIQIFFNYISIVTFLICLIYLLYNFILFLSKRKI